jgi:glycosyltransferase involved in cell wall biosynthesis
MSAPEVSVLVPFLDARPFLDESVASVRAQTCTSWELLLIDEGSHDGGADIARAHAGRDPERVRYLEHPGHVRRAGSVARNVGMRHARGRYVAFLDADDVWLPRKLEAQLAIAETYPEAAMIYSRTQYWYSWTGAAADRARDYTEHLGVPSNTLIRPPELLALILRGRSPVPCPSSVLVRREAAESVGGFEDSFLDLFAEQAFYAKLFLAAPVFAADGCWDRHRQHPSQGRVSATRTGRIRVARRAFLEWLEGYLAERGARDSDVWEALQAARALGGPEAPDVRSAPRAVFKRAVRWAGRRLPARAADWMRRVSRGSAYTPSVGRVRFGDLRRTRPITGSWGLGRGLPIDRYYIEQFLARHAGDIHGRVLEVGDDRYTRRFGGLAVTSSDVLNVSEGHPQTTIVADLCRLDQLPVGRFDCVIIAQTLQLIADLDAAVRGLYQMLQPGGVVFATLPGISQTHYADWGAHWRWSFTGLSARTLFESVFPASGVTVEIRGNVLAATAFLQGLTAEDLTAGELDVDDRDYQVSILVRAKKVETG